MKNFKKFLSIFLNLKLIAFLYLSHIFFTHLSAQTSQNYNNSNIENTSTKNYTELPFYKESEHFIFYCQHIDQNTVDTIIKKLEPFFEKISKELNHNYSDANKAVFKIYPNIRDFHKAINKPKAPDYICGYMYKNKSEVLSVSPRNPGSVHNFDSVITGLFCDIVGLLIKNKYKNIETNLSWLYLGTCLYKSSYYDSFCEKGLLRYKEKLPTIQQLNQAYENYPEFEKIHGWFVSFSLAKFIDTKYGLEKLLALIEKNNTVESILGTSEDGLQKEWVSYLVNNYEKKVSLV